MERKTKKKRARDTARTIVRHGYTMEMVQALNEAMTTEKFAKLADAFAAERDAHQGDS